MKFIFIAVILLLISITLYAKDNQPNPKWKNSLKPIGEDISFSIKECVIVSPTNPNIKVIKAIKDLEYYLSRMIRKNIPIINDSEYKEGSFISVGNTILYQKSPYVNDKIDVEGYGIKGDNKGIYLFGGEIRGPLYAVYSFLEEDLGFRFWSANRYEDYIPITNTISFTPRIVNPVFEARDPYINQAQNTEFALLNKCNANKLIPKELGGAWESWGGLAHTSFNFIPPNKYFKDHPEYFSLEQGKRQPRQICWTNKEVLDIIAKEIIKLKQENYFNCIHISPQDGPPLCECEECKKIYEKEGSKSACLIYGLNYILEKVNKIYPNLKIITLAYLDYITPPKTLKPNKNINILVCSDCHDWFYPLCSIDETEQFRNCLKSWADYGVKVTCWTYITNYSHYIMPYPNILVTAKNNKIIRDLGGCGIFMQGNFNTNSISDSGRMKAWIWAKLLWNPDLDPEELMKDFIYGYYGECAEPIYQYQVGLLNLWKEGHKKPHDLRNKEKDPWHTDGIRWSPECSLYTDKWINESMNLMDEALNLAKDENMKERVELERISLIYLILSRNIGYINYENFRRSLKKEFTTEEKTYYKSLIDDYEKLYNKYKFTLSEEDHSKLAQKLINNQRAVLDLDITNMTIQEMESDKWKFILDPNDEGINKGYFKPRYNCKNWQDAKIKVFWSDFGIENYLKNAWYKKTFTLKDNIIDKKYINMFFGSVDEETTVYINGKLAYTHTVASTGLPTKILWAKPFVFDIKPFLNEGENDISIIVGNPGGNAGGIYEKILIVASNEDLSMVDMESYKLM
ncbi:MAG: DUF4838 domain-containing protein [Abditibacteriota bacterium]|nr:DUF4838 domain-containing protein [Abditibacteriota bacterium]